MLFALFIFVPIFEVMQIEGDFYTTYEEVEMANKNGVFGKFVRGDLKQKDKSTDITRENTGEIVFKLFGFIPIRKLYVNMSTQDDYYIGGVPIGFSITTAGAVVIDGNDTIKKGDIITEINGTKIERIDDIADALTDDEVEIKYIRDNKEIRNLVKTLKTEGKYKLGVVVKDEVTGIGTLTFVNTKTGKFGALGHSVTEEPSKSVIPVESGKIYKCELLGINKGERNNPGQLRCVFVENGDGSGSIEDNNKFGIKGTLENKDGLVDTNLTAQLGGRLSVTPGKAYIVSNISGIREEYEIEIIKANYQKKANDKSMVIRVTDRRLLELTGGIVQGMSGSPILQNGKIIGAVTHVFVSDSTKGYAVYSDWMAC